MNLCGFRNRLWGRFEPKQFLNGRVQDASQFQTDDCVWDIETGFDGMNCLAADAGLCCQLDSGNRSFGPQLREICLHFDSLHWLPVCDYPVAFTRLIILIRGDNAQEGLGRWREESDNRTHLFDSHSVQTCHGNTDSGRSQQML